MYEIKIQSRHYRYIPNSQAGRRIADEMEARFKAQGCFKYRVNERERITICEESEVWVNVNE